MWSSGKNTTIGKDYSALGNLSLREPAVLAEIPD